jgi:Co/Zn/Cd efflux system component
LRGSRSQFRPERNGACSRSGERLRKLREDAQISVQRDPVASTEAKRRQTVLVLEPPEGTLDRAASPVHVLVERGEDCHAKRRQLERLLEREYEIEHTTFQVDHPGQELLHIDSYR